MYLNICASLFFECLTEKLFNRSWSCQSLPFVMLHQAAQTMSTWAWRTSAGNWCLDCFRACTGHLHFSISGHLFFFQNGSLWQQFDWCCLLSIQQGFMYYPIHDILLISGALLVFIPSVNRFFFNSNIPLRTMCLT